MQVSELACLERDHLLALMAILQLRRATLRSSLGVGMDPLRAHGPSGEWSGRAGWCASRDCCIGLAAFLADLRSAPPPAASQPALAATQGGTAANRFAGLLSCHGDTARTADLPSLPNLRDHNGPGRIPAGTAIGTGACLA